MRARRVLAAGAAAMLVLAAAPGAGATGRVASPATMRKVLNAERHSNGIPANLSTNTTWNQRCKQHDNYEAVNHVLTHTEDPHAPGYTKGGAWAGQHSVLSEGSSWAGGDPFVQAPIHFAQLMAPIMNRTGGFELDKGGTIWGCVVTIAGQNRPIPDANHVYTYPGNGRAGIPFAYHAAEGPFTPNELVHTSDDCGQELFVFVFGPALQAGGNPYLTDITKATLHPVGGSNVAVKVADGTTDADGTPLGYYLGQGAGIVIPVKALKPSTTYVANVTVEVNDVVVHHQWQFTTKSS